MSDQQNKTAHDQIIVVADNDYETNQKVQGNNIENNPELGG